MFGNRRKSSYSCLNYYLQIPSSYYLQTPLPNFCLSLSEDKRPHAPTYAVLDSQLGGSEETGQDTSNLRNHALLHYLANLANSNNSNDTFSFEFVESLVRNGADINCSDINGQTVFHEIARAWNVDVATFLVEQGEWKLLYKDKCI